MVNKVFGLQFGEQSNCCRCKKHWKNKAGLIAHTHTQRQTHMQTHTRGNIVDQKHQSGNHTHYTHHLAIPRSLLTSASVWSKLGVCVWVCVQTHTMHVWVSVNAWQRSHAPLVFWQVVFPGRKLKHFQTVCSFACVCVSVKKERVRKKKRDVLGLTHYESWKNMFGVENKQRIFNAWLCLCVCACYPQINVCDVQV